MTSLSEVELKIDPRPSSSLRIVVAFTMLPLCAIATGPPSVLTQMGWALRRLLEPAVE